MLTPAFTHIEAITPSVNGSLLASIQGSPSGGRIGRARRLLRIRRAKRTGTSMCVMPAQQRLMAPAAIGDGEQMQSVPSRRAPIAPAAIGDVEPMQSVPSRRAPIAPAAIGDVGQMKSVQHNRSLALLSNDNTLLIPTGSRECDHPVDKAGTFKAHKHPEQAPALQLRIEHRDQVEPASGVLVAATMSVPNRIRPRGPRKNTSDLLQVS